MNLVLLGAIAMSCAVITLFFLRFWRRTGDRLLVIFAAAFLVLGLNWSLLSIVDHQDERRPWLYTMRLAAFALIIIGIIDKNRTTKRTSQAPASTTNPDA